VSNGKEVQARIDSPCASPQEAAPRLRVAPRRRHKQAGANEDVANGSSCISSAPAARAQQARNLLMELGDRQRQVWFVITIATPSSQPPSTRFLGTTESGSSAHPSGHQTRTPTWSAGSARPPRVARSAADRRPPSARHVLRVYVKHYNRGRPHRALNLQPPDASPPSPVATGSPPQPLRMDRRDLLGGLIHEYNIPAAA
jgi:putative transposase